jgi:hypothetical protein
VIAGSANCARQRSLANQQVESRRTPEVEEDHMIVRETRCSVLAPQ